MAANINEERIEEIKSFIIENESSANKMDCITTLNHAVRLLYADENMKLGSQIDKTMLKLEEYGKIEDSNIIEFLDSKGKKTTGVTEPFELSKSVWDTLIEMTNDESGYYFFGLSIMDGYHSVSLILNNNGDDKIVYWCDQHSACEEFNRESLDEKITTKTVNWWKANAEDGKKMKTRTTLWLLKV
ncbi:MAG: hypothetical protein AB2L26_03070 [Ignavibacteria bacterium]